MPPPCTHTPSGALLLYPDTRQVILIFFSSNGLYRTTAKLSGTCPTVALPISGSRDSEINIDGLPDYRMGESSDVEEIEFFCDSGEES